MKRLWRTVRHYYLFFIALVAATAALGLELTGFHTAAHWLLAIVAAAELLPLLWRMVQDIRFGTYGVDILAATAIVTAVIMQEYWAALVIVLMLTGGVALEDYAEHRADRELKALLERAPAIAHIVRGRKIVDVKAHEVQAGDKIVIRPGEIVPADATVLEGAASFDESSLTGESVPVAREFGDVIVSGSVNLDGAITAKALRAAKDSQYEQIIRLVKSARANQAPFVRLADRYAIPFTILSFGIAVTAWVLSGESIRFLEVLVVATPCPLILAAPIAIISGMSRSAKHGIIVKNGSSLERLATARTFAFDKTGTLTKGELNADRIVTFSGFKRTEVLGYAATLEQHSNHAQAKAIVKKAQAEHARLFKTKNVRELAGRGVVATASGKEVLVGRLSLLKEREVELPKGFKATDHERGTAAFVAIGGKLAGVITFGDEIREDATATLKQLRELGIEDFMIVTGDNRSTATAVAKKLGIKHVVAEALPGEKLLAIEKAKGPTAFVGDGVNDAPVLTASDVGIALGAKGSAAASESADVVLMHDELSRVAQGVEIAKRTFGIAKQSIFIGIGLSVGLMLIFSTGRFAPIYGAAIQEVVDVVVIFNALRAHGGGNKKKARKATARRAAA